MKSYLYDANVGDAIQTS